MDDFFKRLVVDPLTGFMDRLSLFMPNLLLAIAILAVGLLISAVVRFVVHRLLAAVSIDRHAERSGLITLMEKSGMKGGLSRLISVLVFWLLVVMFAIISLGALNLPQVDRILSEFYLYLPNVFVAVAVLFIGYGLSNFLAKAALVSAVNAGIRVSGLLSRTVKAVVMMLTLTVAMEQLGIGRGTILIVFAIMFGGLVLALSLAFGLGGRDIARDYLEGKLKGKEEDKDEMSHL